MSTTQTEILAEIAAEQKELRINIILTILTFIGLVGGLVAPWLAAPASVTTGLFLLAYVAGGYPATRSAFTSLLHRKLNIDLLMVLAALAAAGVGEILDGAILLFLFSLAGTLEGYAMGSTKRSVAGLMQLRPDEANRLNPDGTTERIPVESLAIGDSIIVRPAERIPVDGTILSGSGAVNQAPITGESVPVDKTVDDKVFAGSVNENALLTITVTTAASNSTLARMITLVTEAQANRSPSEQFGDWFRQRYTIFVLVGSITALGVFILLNIPLDDALYKAATLLVVASPCAIVISVPAAILSALASSARNGVLFKGGAALEDFGHVNAIAFDKTGTLTHGTMTVTDAVAVGDKTTFLTIAGQLEAQSDHPLARSVMFYISAEGITPPPTSDVVTIPGQGLKATINGTACWAGNRALMQAHDATLPADIETAVAAREATGETPVIVGQGSQVLGYFTLADTLRNTAPAAFTALIKAGVSKLVMLTGDSQSVANAIGNKLGLKPENIKGSLMPDEKVAAVADITKTHTVAFVGDGVNDAAALATARVGIAMGVAGTDAAIEAADVALLSNDLGTLVFAQRLSRQTNRIIRQNLIFACGIMAIMVILTLFWYLPLPLGVVGHEGGTLLVVLNGLRLLWQNYQV